MKYSKEFKIGVFVVVVLTASFFVINYLRGKDIFNKEIEIVSQYENVEGLVESAPVFIKGYKAGKVTEVAYRPEVELFKVTCSVKKEFRIPSDSKMTIYAVDIMGGKGVKIDLGTSSEYVTVLEGIQEIFPGVSIYEKDQDQAIAKGAAIYATALLKEKQPKVNKTNIFGLRIHKVIYQ